jgi:hypothetical protein
MVSMLVLITPESSQSSVLTYGRSIYFYDYLLFSLYIGVFRGLVTASLQALDFRLSSQMMGLFEAQERHAQVKLVPFGDRNGNSISRVDILTWDPTKSGCTASCIFGWCRSRPAFAQVGRLTRHEVQESGVAAFA